MISVDDGTKEKKKGKARPGRHLGITGTKTVTLSFFDVALS